MSLVACVGCTDGTIASDCRISPGSTGHECVMIGDGFESDVQGALNAGWDAVHFSESNDPFEGSKVKSLIELQGLF